MRVHDPAAGKTREADVRQGGEREPCVAHVAEGAQGNRRPRPVIRPDRCDVEACKAPCGRLGADAAGDLGLVVEREQRDDRERRDLAHRLDGDDELLEVEEGLDHEQVDAASLEHACLLGIERAVLGGVEHLELAERADRARDEDVAARDLACLPRDPDARRVDLLEGLVEEEASELAPVGAERVRLDQLRPRRDVARMHRDHALGRAHVGLLGTAQAGDGAGDQRAHAAVGDERWAGSQTIEKTAHGAATLDTGIGEAGLPPGPRSDTTGSP
jgi:hypothetical protein